jgi:leader peptidase (prepilin peptidase)/N-methyltransferase
MDWLQLTLLTGLGLILGSFLSVVIYRIRHEKPGLIMGNSACPKCNKKLGPQDLIPVFSYIFLMGKCRQCNEPIPWHYPVLELSTGLLFLAIGMAGFTPLWLYLFYGLVLIFIFFYDLLYLEVPDIISIPAIAIAVLGTLATGTTNFIDGLLGASVIVGFFLLQIILSKGKWLGGGDLRIGAFIGFVLGFQLTILATFLAYLIGATISLILLALGKVSRKTMIAFGPFLVFGTLIALFYGHPIIDWYFSLINLSV